jgi:hypothetical protein
MKRTTLAGLSVVMLLVIVLIVGLLVFRPQVRGAWQIAQAVSTERQDLAEGHRFPEALAEAKAQGLPTSAAGLQKPLPPPERNAAPVYVRLMQLTKTHPFTPTEEGVLKVHPGVDPTPAQWVQIAELLHDRSTELALVHQAAARPDCVFTRDWATPDPADIQFPELATVRNAAYLLRLESMLMAHQGKYEAAVRNQALGFQIARHGASDGLIIPYLVGVAGDSITLDGLRRIMTMAGPNVSLDDTVGDIIARDWKIRSLATVLHSETGFDLGDIAYLRQAGPQGLDEAAGGRSARTTLAAQGIDIGRWNNNHWC